MRTSLRLAISLVAALSASAQLGMFSREQRIDFTREWKGERFEDGRPKVPDSILERMGEVTAEEAWSVLQSAGYRHQFEGNWQQIATESGKRLVGRAVTAVFMPMRPDVNTVIVEHAKKEGRAKAGGQNSWVIDTLQPGDVLVVDLFGKIKEGTFIGDNLSTSVRARTQAGAVIDGGIRDYQGVRELTDVAFVCR